METLEQVNKSINELETKVKEVEEVKSSFLENISSFRTSSENSDEKKALKMFGCSHVKQLLDVNTADARFAYIPEEIKGQVKQLKADVDVARYVAQIFRDDPTDKQTDGEVQARACKSILQTNFGREVLAPKLKAFGSTVSGGGDEWVPTLISSSYIQEYTLEHILEKKFQQRQMPSNPHELSVQNAIKKAVIASENTASTDTNFGTTSISLAAKKLVEYHILPEELSEDSAVDILMAARDHVILSQIRAVESAIINGDDDGTHIDSDTQAGAANLAEKAWKGLRRQALANSANGSTVNFTGAGVTEAKLKDMRIAAGKHGVNPLELLWVVSPSVYGQMLNFDSVSTLDKFGPQATVFKGALDIYKGIPIVVSEHMREDLNATGVYDGVTTTLGALLLVNTKRWYVGIRRPIKVLAQPDLPNQDRFLLASYQRKAFAGHVQNALEQSVIYGYNVLI